MPNKQRAVSTCTEGGHCVALDTKQLSLVISSMEGCEWEAESNQGQSLSGISNAFSCEWPLMTWVELQVFGRWLEIGELLL